MPEQVEHKCGDVHVSYEKNWCTKRRAKCSNDRDDDDMMPARRIYMFNSLIHKHLTVFSMPGPTTALATLPLDSKPYDS